MLADSLIPERHHSLVPILTDTNIETYRLSFLTMVSLRKLVFYCLPLRLKPEILCDALKTCSFSPLSKKTGAVAAEICFCWDFFFSCFVRSCEYDRSHHYRRCLSVSYCGAPPFSAHCHHPTSGLCEKSLQSSADQMPEWRRNTNSLHSLLRGILAKLCSAGTPQKYRQ